MYYLHAKARIAQEIAAHPDTTESDYHIYYRNYPHTEALAYGAVGGTAVGAAIGWMFDVVRRKRSGRNKGDVNSFQ